MRILDHKQIHRKVTRLSLEILERAELDAPLYVGGINQRGQQLAALISDELGAQSSIQTKAFHIQLNPANPLDGDIVFDIAPETLNGKNVLIVDDVANTGRTLFYACAPLMHVLPKKLETAVLVDRKHKSFPIHVDYVGLSLATTFMENIRVELEDVGDMRAVLE